MKSFLLENTILFSNFTEAQVEDLLVSLQQSIQQYKKNEYILHAGEQITYFGVVLSGRIVIENTDFLGNQIVLAENQKGAIFAEIYAYLGKIPLMVDVRATENTEVLFLDLAPLHHPSLEKKSWYVKFLRNLLTVSAKKNIAFSNRSFHTSSKRVRDRIASYLSSQAILHASNQFTIPFNRQEMSDYLNLDRTALSNELSKMEKEGLISFKKNLFTLNEQHFDL